MKDSKKISNDMELNTMEKNETKRKENGQNGLDLTKTD